MYSQTKRDIITFFGCIICCVSLGSSFIIPALMRKSQSFEEETGIQSNITEVSSVGDSPEDEPEAYHYWYAPQSSFGIKSTKTLNETHFKNLFRNAFSYLLEYRIGDIWVEGNQYLTVGFDWQDAGFWKINLTFTKPPSPEMDVRFTVGVNKQVLSYVDKAEDDFCYWLNYSANATEVYNCYFNFSDLMGIQDLIFNHGVFDELFWFRFRKDDVPENTEEKVYVFDPTFGNEDDTLYGTGNLAIETTGKWFVLLGANYTASQYFIPNNITALLYGENNVDCNVKCAIYDPSDWSLLYETESKFVDHGASYQWWTFNITGASQLPPGKYMLSALGDADSLTDTYEAMKLVYNNNHPEDAFKQSDVGSFTMPEPAVATDYEANQNYSIYCNYTAGGAVAPTITFPNPADETFNQSATTVICNTTIIDANGNTSTVDFYTSPDNSVWTWVQTNTTVLNESVQFSYTTGGYQTTYYWNVTANDETYNTTSSTYSFETTPYRTLHFNDTYPNENWIDSSNNVTFEAGWENYTVVIGGVPYSHNGDFNDGAEDALIVTEDGFYHDDSDDNGWLYGANTPSSDTGASSPYEGTKMLYIESSSSNYNQDNYLDYPIQLTASTNVTVEFQYHMYGAGIAWLAVQVVDSSGVAEDIWNVSGNKGDTWFKGIAGIDDGASFPYAGSYEIRIHGKSTEIADFHGDICIDWVFVNQTNVTVGESDGFILSDEIFIPDTVTYDWDEFYADVDIPNNCSFALVDPDDTDYNITSGLTGDGDDISSVTNASVMIFGNFSGSDDITMGSWNISWAISGGEEPPGAIWNLSKTGWLSGGNDTVSYSSDISGWLSGGNDTLSWSDSTTGYLVGGNDTLTWSNSVTGWLSGGNETSTAIWNLSKTGYLIGGNDTLIWALDIPGWLSGGNDTLDWDVSTTGYLTGGNDTLDYSISIQGWLSGGNETSATVWNLSKTAYLTGGNDTLDWDVSTTGYLIGGNEPAWDVSTTGYLIGGSAVVFNTVDTGWLSGGNDTMPTIWNLSKTGWLSGGNDTYLSCSFTYTVKGSVVTATPTIIEAIRYKWVIEDNAETRWIPIADIHNYQVMLPANGNYKITLIAEDDFTSVSFMEIVTIRISVVGDEKEPDPVEKPKKPRVRNIFEDTGMADWFENRNIGELVFISIIGICAFFMLFRRRRKKSLVYPINKK